METLPYLLRWRHERFTLLCKTPGAPAGFGAGKGKRMQIDTFRKWLLERGCTFEQTERSRGGLGHVAVTARRKGRRATLQSAGAKDDLDPDEVIRVVEALGLDASDLPGPRSRS